MVGLVRLPLIPAADEPVAPPVIPPVTIGNDQLYVVPAGTIPLVPFTGVVENATPLQLTAVIAVTDATGLIVTVIENALPVQLPDTGVTI